MKWIDIIMHRCILKWNVKWIVKWNVKWIVKWNVKWNFIQLLNGILFNC